MSQICSFFKFNVLLLYLYLEPYMNLDSEKGFMSPALFHTPLLVQWLLPGAGCVTIWKHVKPQEILLLSWTQETQACSHNCSYANLCIMAETVFRFMHHKWKMMLLEHLEKRILKKSSSKLINFAWVLGQISWWQEQVIDGKILFFIC